MKYNIIYADPPWAFKTYSQKGKEKKSAENHYQTMNKIDIQNLPISNIAAAEIIQSRHDVAIADATPTLQLLSNIARADYQALLDERKKAKKGDKKP